MKRFCATGDEPNSIEWSQLPVPPRPHLEARAAEQGIARWHLNESIL